MEFPLCIDRILKHPCLLPPPSDPQAGLQAHDLEIRLTLIARERNREIEDYLEECKKQDRSLMKILLLGGPACGKSTIFKQMRIIHKEGFKDQHELEFFADLISRNVRTAFEQLCDGANSLAISTLSILNVIRAIEIIWEEKERQRGTGRSVPSIGHQLATLLAKFWATPSIQAVYDQRHKLLLIDSSKYFLDNIMRIGADNFVPTEDDILHSREPTTSITYTTFKYNDANLRLVDVGGQQSQRRKWIHLFDDVRVVLFIVDLTVYARNEDEFDIGSLQQTKVLFREIAINKVDLFEELLKSVPFRNCCTDYTGENSLGEVSDYLIKLFKDAARPRSSRSMVPYLTTATNTENIKHVFEGCMESVFKQSSRATGIM